jgi:hypothetical protein
MQNTLPVYARRHLKIGVAGLRRSRGLGRQKVQVESAAPAKLARHVDGAAMGHDDAVGDRQPKAGNLAKRLGGKKSSKTRDRVTSSMPQPVSLTQIGAKRPGASPPSCVPASSSSTTASNPTTRHPEAPCMVCQPLVHKFIRTCCSCVASDALANSGSAIRANQPLTAPRACPEDGP